jgi:hypothetical protein
MKLNTIRVTRTMEYNPETYLECCEEDGTTPTQEGFLEFVQDWINEDFRNNNGAEDIREIPE